MVLASAQQMREIDQIAITQRHIPSLDLMEHAAEGIAAAVFKLLPKKMKYAPRAAVFCGSGNNGGDGIAAARLLMNNGVEVQVYLVGDREKMTPDALAMEEKLCAAGGELLPYPQEESNREDVRQWCRRCHVIVDALFGVGLCRDIEGLFADAVACINESAAPVVAADIASGIDADTGRILGVAVHAHTTVTFSLAKIGQFVGDGSVCTGKLVVHEIGIPWDVLQHREFSVCTIDRARVRELLPLRPQDGHKGMFGKDYILAGSVDFTGAPVLAARAAARMGAGLVYVGTPQTAWSVVAGKCLSEMPQPLPEKSGKVALSARGMIAEKIKGCHAVLIGPGLGRSGESDALICQLCADTALPLVLDADGINAVAAHIDSLDSRRGRVTILTPHDGEFARVGGNLTDGARLNAAGTFAKEHGCFLVLKGHRTIVAAPDGRLAINTTGNSGMAKGGSGDILSGMIVSLLGQGMDAFSAACCAVWMHGRAGDLAAKEKSERAMLPTDLLEQLSEVCKEF